MNRVERLGAWLFRHRGWLPVPLVLISLISTPRFVWPGLVLVAGGEALRLFAVGHIGRRSRTFGDSVGSLVDSGPYARVRNPLYLGNFSIWAGIGLVGWPAFALVIPLIMVHYGCIVRWEEHNLRAQMGEPYAEYCARVPRWLPVGRAVAGTYDWREALRSERGTFAMLSTIATAFMFRWYLGS